MDELVELQLSDFDHLISKKKVEDGDEIEDILNDCTRHDRTAWGEETVQQFL